SLSLSLGMEMVIDALRHRFADAVDALEIGEAGARDAARRAEMMQQRLLALAADAGNLVERRHADLLGAARAMRADGEAMRLVAQALQEVEHRVLGIEAEGRLARAEEALAPGVAVGPLGDRRHGDVVDAEIGQHLADRGELPGAAVDEQQIGPRAFLARRVLLQGAGEAA